jgi:hypothetical protein
VSRFGGRVQLGRKLAEDLGGELERPDTLIDDTVLAELIKERMRYNSEFGDNPEMPDNMLDSQLKDIYLDNGILSSKAPAEELDIPEDPEMDRLIDEANLSPLATFTGERRNKEQPKDKPDTKIADTEKQEKLAKKEAKIREIVTNMALRQGNELTPEQLMLAGNEGKDNPIAALTDIKNADINIDKEIYKDQLERDKPLHGQDELARKLIAYYDDPEGFEKTWYKEHPVFEKRRTEDGRLENREIIFDEDNPDPDLEGIELVKYADAMNRKFPPGKGGFIEYDYGPTTKSGDTKHPADPLKAAATGKEMTEPEKLEFPEVIKSDIDPARNRLGMVRRMLFGKLSEEQLEYLMELMEQDQQFADGGFVDNPAFRFLQKRYGPNHPVLSDKRFKKRYVGRLAANIRRVV